MSDVLETKALVTSDNDKYAIMVRKMLEKHHVYLVNVMSSPGAGKTSLLMRTIKALKNDYRIGVMEADVDSDTDARKIEALGVKTVQLHTLGSCHMDAKMTLEGLQYLGLDDLDFVFLENIGNLVCPAEFDVGAQLKAMLLSVPEGDDKPLKYPLMFKISDVLVLNKTDTLPVFNFNTNRLKNNLKPLNPSMPIIPISAKNGEGIEDWISFLKERVKIYENH